MSPTAPPAEADDPLVLEAEAAEHDAQAALLRARAARLRLAHRAAPGVDLLDLGKGGRFEREYPMKAGVPIAAGRRGELTILKGRPPLVARAEVERWLATRTKPLPSAPIARSDFGDSYEASVRRAG